MAPNDCVDEINGWDISEKTFSPTSGSEHTGQVTCEQIQAIMNEYVYL